MAKGTVTATTAFHELGLSSRQMVELLRQVEVALDVDLPPTVVFSVRPCARSRTRSSGCAVALRSWRLLLYKRVTTAVTSVWWAGPCGCRAPAMRWKNLIRF